MNFVKMKDRKSLKNSGLIIRIEHTPRTQEITGSSLTERSKKKNYVRLDTQFYSNDIIPA